MNILGISAFYHDSAATIISDGEIIAATQEERFSRIKNDASFPARAIEYCLQESLLEPDMIDAVVFYDKPWLKFERLLETYCAYAPRGLRSFLAAIPVWLKEKLFLKSIIKRELKKIGLETIPTLLFTEHHLSHAASAFYPSPFERAAILTIDGVGEWATASISLGEGRNIEVLRELHFPHSLGLLYSAFTYYLGFKVNSGEYKLMGLAPYGDPESAEVAHYESIITNELIDIKDDGSIWLDQRYFSYATSLKMVQDKTWARLFGFERRQPSDKILTKHCNFAMAIQRVTEKVVLNMAKEAKRLTGCDHLCMAGGVALNCVSNGHLMNAKVFDQLFVQPAAGDAGGSLGAALAAHHIFFEQDRAPTPDTDAMRGAYLGLAISEPDIQRTIRKYNAKSHYYSEQDLYAYTAKQLEQGLIVGWVQGRAEFGPRALGNRSILADARNPKMQSKLNQKIKYRETFRPFAPSVLAEYVDDYFAVHHSSPYLSPYMLEVQNVQPHRQVIYPQNETPLSMIDKLYRPHSDLPTTTHVDYSSRIQTVHQQTNMRYWKLLDAFKQKTGCAVIANTSFNVRGEPIVNTPDDAYRCFMQTDMDILVMGDCVFIKAEQPNWPEQRQQQAECGLD